MTKDSDINGIKNISEDSPLLHESATISDKIINEILAYPRGVISIIATIVISICVFPLYVVAFIGLVVLFVTMIKTVFSKKEELFFQPEIALEITKWPQVEAYINSATLKEEPSEATMYEVLITYGYTVNNYNFVGNEIHPHYRKSSNEKQHREILKALYPGRKIYVYYNPENLRVSYLSGGINNFSYYCSNVKFGGLFIILMGTVVVFMKHASSNEEKIFLYSSIIVCILYLLIVIIRYIFNPPKSLIETIKYVP